MPALLACGGLSRRGAWVREEAERALSPSDFAQVAHVFVDGERWRAIERDVAAANALDPTAPRIRVYLLEEASAATPARAGSLSRLGGRAGLPAARVPKDDDGEPLVHILTIDVEDAPELRSRYPEAAAIALFTPAPREGGRAEESAIVAVPRAKGAKAGTGRALAVFGIDVPQAVFDATRADEPAFRAVLDRIVHAGGHLFGRPFWLQGNPIGEGDGDGFVMQIDDGLSDELNLGDGSLYVYESGIIVQSL